MSGMTTDGATRRTFAIGTLGCKLNQYESECLRHRLEKAGWQRRRFEEGASFYIINSCTVTAKTDARTRNLVRRARRAAPPATIIVTGCYAQTQPEALRAMGEVDVVLGNGAKPMIPAMMEKLATGVRRPISPAPPAAPGASIDLCLIDAFLDHSRAFIKIQEGCNASCAYCIIPAARGASRSAPPGFIVDQVRRLESNGFEEIVLTGIHIGRYGADLGEAMDIAGLLETILDRTRRARLRLSSIEVTEVTDRLIGLVAHTERIAPHLHIPLQSGDDEILASMNRPYRTESFRATIEKITEAVASISIGTDIIVGFPGEGEAQFLNSYRLAGELPFGYFHVFNFSRRPGTRAAAMAGQVSAAVRQRRSARLIALGLEKKRVFMRSLIGSRQWGLVQGPSSETPALSRVLTGPYCEVLVPCAAELAGKLAPIRVTHAEGPTLYGALAEDHRPAEVGAEQGCAR